MDDEYFTIQREARVEIRVKGSRFIGEAFPVAGVEEALERLEEVRKREHAATHHCYAYQVGLSSGRDFRYSDDGEPQGTAGKPIYDIVSGSGLTNVLVVVTRYFGGTKLGAGGLVRAYSDASKHALQQSGRKTVYMMTTYRVVLAYSVYDRFFELVNRLDGRVNKSDFSDVITLEVRIRRGSASEFEAAVRELTGGKGKIETIE
jgi:uncharacterized YigZ family protein